MLPLKLLLLCNSLFVCLFANHEPKIGRISGVAKTRATDSFSAVPFYSRRFFEMSGIEFKPIVPKSVPTARSAKTSESGKRAVRSWIDIWWKSFRNINETKLVGIRSFRQCAEWSCKSHFVLSLVSVSLRCFLWNQVGRAPSVFRLVSFYSPAKPVRRSRASLDSWISRIPVDLRVVFEAGNFRHDGKLLTAGDEKGNIKLFDVETKTMLRQAQPHSSAVHAVDFFSTTQLLSGSDDKTICLYDIPTNMVINTYAGHTVRRSIMRIISRTTYAR